MSGGARKLGEADAIAVIGMDCRFPGEAENVDKLWEMLCRGRDGWSEIPEDRMSAKRWYHPDQSRPGGIHIRGGHFLKEDIAAFDAPFFSLSTDEATSMDPQQRILLEVVYNAFERAGITLEELSGSPTGVWCGNFVRDYEQVAMRDPACTPPYAATGNGIAILANRISHVFNLAGTSQTIDTGCSASMVCVHEACKSLLSGETSLAVAAGVGLMFSPNTIVPMANLNILSPDGRCFTFDERANGYGRGEGVGAVILKRFSDAIRDNDTIRAVIRATSSNQDGQTQGITLPSRQRQIDNMTGIYKNSGLDPRKTAYVECHGTGTQKGDRIELEAVSAALCQDRPVSRPLIVGSVKTNVGHLEGSAGVAGLIKGILVVEKGTIPEHLNFERPNPKLNFDELRVQVAKKNIRSWPGSPRGLRQVSVNSFGFGGTNAHAVLQDAPHFMQAVRKAGHHISRIPRGSKLSYMVPTRKTGAATKTSSPSADKLFVFSAQDQAGLDRVIKAHRQYLSESHPGPAFLSDYAYTLSSRRSRLDCRTFTMAKSVDELIYKLEKQELQPGTPMDIIKRSRGDIPVLALVFAGQGSQWHAMGRELLLHSNAFKRSFSASCRYLRGLDKFLRLWNAMFRPASTKVMPSHIAQPLITAIQIALVDLLKSCGIKISAVVGHSSGEIAAAYAADLLSKNDALKVAFHRGREAKKLRKGAMAAIQLSKKAIQKYTDKLGDSSVGVACDNGPSCVTMSGNPGGIEELLRLLEKDQVKAKKLSVEQAYHSHHIDMIRGDYESSLKDIQPRPYLGKIRMFSSVHGEELQWGDLLSPTYWANNLRGEVLFYDAVSQMFDMCEGLDTIVEVSPQKVWEAAIKTILAEKKMSSSLGLYSSLLVCEPKKTAWDSTLETLGQLWAQGVEINMDWLNLRSNGAQPAHRVDVPTYPWDRSRTYWHESHISKENRFTPHGREDLIGAPVDLSTPITPRWRGFFRLSENPWIQDHQVQKAIVYPAAGMIAMAVEAAKQLADPTKTLAAVEITSFEIRKPMLIPQTNHGLEHMISCNATDLDIGEDERHARYSFMIQSKPQDCPWVLHATGNLEIRYQDARDHQQEASQLSGYVKDYQEVQSLSLESVVPRQFYECLDIFGMSYGPQFRNIVEIRKGVNVQAATSRIRIPDTKGEMPHQFEFDHIIHPATLDAMIQTVFGTGEESMLPAAIESITINADLPKGAGSTFLGHCKLEKQGLNAASAKIVMFDDQMKQAAVVIKNLSLKALPRPAGGAGFLPTDRNLCSQIVWKPDVELCGTSAADFFDSMAHKNPSLSVLQLGGSAELANRVIDHLRGPDRETPRFSRYDVSIESKDEFAAIAERYEKTAVADRLSHLAAPADRCYDIVICCGNRQDDPSNLPPTVREGETACSTTVQDELSELVGEKVTVYLPKLQPPSKKAMPTTLPQLIVLAPCDKALFPRQYAQLYELLKSSGAAEIITCDLSDIPAMLATYGNVGKSGKQKSLTIPVLSLLELTCPLLSSMSSEQFDLVKSFLLTAKNVLWVANGGQTDQSNPLYGAVVGLARTLRSEDATKNLVTLDASSAIPGTLDLLARHIVDVFVKGFVDCAPGQKRETEYALIDGQICIPRLLLLPEINGILERGPKQACGSVRRSLQDVANVHLSLPSICSPDGPVFDCAPQPSRSLDVNEVRIQTRSTFLAPQDAKLIRGEGSQTVIGVDVCGTIIEVGENVDQNLKGTKVIAMARGTIANQIIVDHRLTMPCTNNKTHSLTADLTAVHVLVSIGGLERDQSVFIFGAASIFGQSAVHFARIVGANVYAGYSTPEQHRLLLSQMHIPEDHLIDTSVPGFVQKLMEKTSQQGVDVVFNHLPKHTTDAIQCASEFGRIAQAVSEVTEISQVSLRANQHFQAFDFCALAQKRPRVLEKAKKDLQRLDAADEFCFYPCGRASHSYGELEQAFAALTSDPYRGVHVLEAKPGFEIALESKLTQETVLDPEATYLLVGGLGGIGRSIAELFVKKGARSLAFMSRSGGDEEAKSFLSQLSRRGIVARSFAVDISNDTQLRRIIDEMQSTMLPIKGVVQCAAVFHDTPFDKLEHLDWAKVFDAKALGTWNLHVLLPKDLNFFVCLSSSSGIIGNRSQAAYAAGNTVQDAVARNRTAMGLPGSISLDVGIILGAGLVSMDEHLLDSMRCAGFFGMRLEHLHWLILRAITPNESETVRLPSQVVTTVGTGGLILQNQPSDPFWARTPMFAFLNQVDALPESDVGGLVTGINNCTNNNLRAAISSTCGDATAAASIVATRLIAFTAKRKGMVPADFDPDTEMTRYGIDSLDSMAIIGWISRETDVTVQTLEGVTIAGLSKRIAETVLEDV